MQNCHLPLSHLNNNLLNSFRYFFKYANNQYLTPHKEKHTFTLNFMAPFYGWSSTASSQHHFKEAVYFLPLSSQKFLKLTYHMLQLLITAYNL